MPHAELRGKISQSGSNAFDRLEDLLTSDVFGRLRYLPPDRGLIPVLQQAVNLQGNRGCPLPQTVSPEPDYQFWPWLKRCEPDVLIQLSGDEGKPFLVLVECKYRSPKSDRPGAEANGDVEERSALPDQLAREFLDLTDWLSEQGGDGILLYVTGHSVLPRSDLETSAAALAGEAGSNRGNRLRERFLDRTYWIGWPAMWAVFRELYTQEQDPYRRRILGDLLDLLAHKGYRRFRGWPEPNPAGPLPPPPSPVWYRRDT
ncbi:hypothetical protein [Symbiobacterium thermophilum]|uniref:Uncharacterized protein n=1 Tax=Symbiobacterium thermophilum TaxID=2734 RepID=A0A953LG03_SYMTR|nr:hypothetical protein [Symbiobacterium thermophilum]MBY6278150.1 hypothetical protein [Symbiobacterium thermophilum]